MKQITEDYVSYENAVLLKEKGFDPSIDHYYDTNGRMDGDFTTEAFPCCTHQMALKWLREVHNIHIEIRYVPNQFTDEPSYKAMIWDMSEEIGKPLPDDIEYMFYETCVNDAIKYTLENLI